MPFISLPPGRELEAQELCWIVRRREDWPVLVIQSNREPRGFNMGVGFTQI